MAKPSLTFFCELNSEDLKALFDQFDLGLLKQLNASISMGIVDLTQTRAEVVQSLNREGIPVIGWLLLPMEEGYWFNLNNGYHAAARYDAFISWTRQHGLIWDSVGFDIEPDIHDLIQLSDNKLAALPQAFRHLLTNWRISGSRQKYLDLVKRVRRDGYRVDSYQLPLIADERIARSSLLQRAAGLVDLPADREVLLLYTSFMRPLGPGVIWSYGQQAQSIALGITGGGVNLKLVDPTPLSWQEFVRDLRLAWVFTDDIHIFSLEGCHNQGFLPKLGDFEWDVPLFEPEEQFSKVSGMRRSLQMGLWFSSRPHLFAALTALVIFLIVRGRSRKRIDRTG
jgi:hypothetical protein